MLKIAGIVFSGFVLKVNLQLNSEKLRNLQLGVIESAALLASRSRWLVFVLSL